MPVLTTPQELVAALGSSAFAADPLADLKKRGYTLNESLASQWQTAMAASRKAAPPIKSKVPLNFQAPLAPIVPAAPPANGYDAVAGISLAAADLALSALYDSGTIPHQIALDQLLSQTELLALGGAFKVDRPGGQISRLHITAAPTLTAIANGSNIVALQLPIQIDWNQNIMLAGRQIQKTITDAVGTLQLTMSLAADVVSRPQTNSSTMTISVKLVTNATAATSPRFTLNPSSPVQLTNPAPANQIDGTAVLIQNVLNQQFGNSLSFTISPHFSLPIGDLEIRHVDVVTSGAAVVAGLQVVGTQGVAKPTQLTSLLPNGATNIFLQVQQVVTDLLLQKTLHSGALAASAKASQDNAVVDSVSSSFQNNSIVVEIKGHLVNECPIHIDLGFIHTRTISVKLEGGKIEIDQSDNSSIAEWSNLWCLLSSLGFIGLAVLGGAVLGGLGVAIGAGVLAVALSGVGPFLLEQAYDGIVGGGGNQPVFVDLTSPIPGTDKLPALSNAFFQITNGALLMAATAALQPDNVNTVIYVRFLVPDGGITVLSSKPLVGATVQLMDQDAPPPAGDDAPTTTPPTQTTGLPGKPSSSTKFTFVPAGSDQLLGQGKTDLDGTVRFALTKDQLVTTGGTIKGVTTHFDKDFNVISTTNSSTKVVEAEPDLYFRVTMPNGSVVDTRTLPGGFMLNFQSARIGTLAKPRIFTFGASGTGVFEATV